MIPITETGFRPVMPRRTSGDLRLDLPHGSPHDDLQAPPQNQGIPLLAARQVVKSYRKGRHTIPVLRGVDFQVQPAEFTAIVGQSGSGKSTLLHLLGTLDAPDQG